MLKIQLHYSQYFYIRNGHVNPYTFCQAQLSSLKPQLKLSFSFIPSFSPPTTPPHPTTGKVFKAQLQAYASRF